MKQLFALCLTVMCLFAQAQDSTGNLVTNQWSGTVPYTGTGGGTSGGATPGYNATTNTIHFGYNVGTAAQIIAINNALSGSGVQISGYNYSWQYYNQDSYRGTLNGSIKLLNASGAALEQYSYAHPTTTQGWTTMSGTQNFNQQYGLNVAKNLEVSFTGNDATWWAGYYGPMVRDVNVSLRYTGAAVVTTPTFGDDTYVAVPLQFGFPFYGKTFTNSWMHSNGVVSFFDPAVPIGGSGFNPGSYAYCCGERVTSTRPEFSYIIAPLMTDLYPSANSTFRTEGTTTYQKYFWNNIGEISNGNNLNTFSLEIRPTGYIGTTYDMINIQNQNTWAGTAGDINAGQINERFWGVPGLNANLSNVANWTMDSTDQCVSNPLSSPSCPGYTDAMCSADPLYLPSCPNYAQAYFTQQCSISALYNSACPGYAEAYKTQQCTLNPLYATDCPGYEQAYLNAQCIKDSLYSKQCEGYATAYAIKYLVNLDPAVTTAVNQQLTTTNEIAKADPAKVTVVNATIDSVLAAPATTSATGVTSVTSVIAPPPPPPGAPAPTAGAVSQALAPPPPPPPAVQQERAADAKKTEGAVAGVERKAGGNTANARAAATEAAKELAKKAGEAATMESQTATQGLVVGLMGYVPGFASYQNATIPDALGAQVARQYHKPTVDNRSAQRQLSGSNEYRWKQMVDSQYRGN